MTVRRTWIEGGHGSGCGSVCRFRDGLSARRCGGRNRGVRPLALHRRCALMVVQSKARGAEPPDESDEPQVSSRGASWTPQRPRGRPDAGVESAPESRRARRRRLTRSPGCLLGIRVGQKPRTFPGVGNAYSAVRSFLGFLSRADSSSSAAGQQTARVATPGNNKEPLDFGTTASSCQSWTCAARREHQSVSNLVLGRAARREWTHPALVAEPAAVGDALEADARQVELHTAERQGESVGLLGVAGTERTPRAQGAVADAPTRARSPARRTQSSRQS